MREIISIHIGQAGCQLGSSLWELYNREHGIAQDGTIKFSETQDKSYQTFYQDTGSGKYVPRAIFMDLEPSVVDGDKDKGVQEAISSVSVDIWKGGRGEQLRAWALYGRKGEAGFGVGAC